MNKQDVIVIVGSGLLFDGNSGTNSESRHSSAVNTGCESGSLLARTLQNTPDTGKAESPFERYGYLMFSEWGRGWYPSAETRIDTTDKRLTVYVRLDFVFENQIESRNIWVKKPDLFRALNPRSNDQKLLLYQYRGCAPIIDAEDERCCIKCKHFRLMDFFVEEEYLCNLANGKPCHNAVASGKCRYEPTNILRITADGGEQT